MNLRHAIALANRITSSFPVSIGTAMAMESLFPGVQSPYDDSRKIVRVPLGGFDELWVNVRTMLRNLLGSLEKDADPLKLHPDEYAHTLESEMAFIAEQCESYGQGALKPVFYVSEYANLSRRFAYAEHRGDPSTPKGQATATLHAKVLGRLDYSPDRAPAIPEKYRLLKFKERIQPTGSVRGLIITHYPIDLLQASRFASLKLLESHTGAVRDRDQWNRKFSTSLSDADRLIVPFNAMTLQVFGDPEMFKAKPKNIRDAVLELARQKRWTSTTQDTQVRAALSSFFASDPYVSKVLNQMLTDT